MFFFVFSIFFCIFAPKFESTMQKKTSFYIFFVLLTIVSLSACTPRKPSVAELRREKRERDSIALLQQRQSLVYYDSLLQAALVEIDPLLKQFEYSRESDYEDYGHYVHRALKTSRNTSRNFLQVYANDNFQAAVKAYYCGGYKINMHSLELCADSVTTRIAGHPHSFSVEGEWHETLAIDGDEALNVLRFIDGYSNRKVRVRMVGEKTSYQYILPASEIEAIVDTYDLAQRMADIHKLENMVKTTSLQVEKYEKRLQK